MILIRPIKKGDIESVLSIYSYYCNHTAITFEYTAPSLIEFTDRISEILKKYPYIVAELKGEVIGYAYGNQLKHRDAYEWTVEGSIYVHPNHRHKGLGVTLYKKLQAYLKAQGVCSLYACITTTNEIDDPYVNNESYVFHEKLGYEEVGHFKEAGYKFNKWYDVKWMHLPLQDKKIPMKRIKYIKNIDKNFIL